MWAVYLNLVQQPPMSTFILGRDVTLYILTSASPEEFTVIGCARNVKIVKITDTAEKTTKGSGTKREYKPLATSWTGSIDGLSSEDGITIRQLWSYQDNLTVLTMQFDLGDGGLPVTGDIILTSAEAGGNYNDAATYNVSFQGTGDLSLTGLYPEDFHIILVQPDTPGAGQTTLTFDFNEPSPQGTSYTIRITKLSDGSQTFSSGGAAPRTVVVTEADKPYSFAIRTETPSGPSDWSPEITYP